MKTEKPFETRKLFLMISLCWLAGWLIKFPFFDTYLLNAVFKTPFFNPFFPAPLQSSNVSAAAYLSPLILAPLLILRRRSTDLIFSAAITLCAMILSIHWNTCNDATFITSTWVGLWMCLYRWHADDGNLATIRHLRMMGLCIIGMFFVGGTVGKLTPEFIAGETLDGIFFQFRDYWPHTWIREHFSPGGRIAIAQTVAHMILLTEGLLILAPLLPCTVTLVVLSMTLSVMIVFCTYNILSVNACVFGLAVGCLWMERHLSSSSSQHRNPSDQSHHQKG